ncbi:DUF5709 domain-containing protein [Streptomyces sp. NPDC056488]|uniref:DUF5709 domain-containing protein n=1 Tax=unclassified Streptomyces TaxID=2593676 RepID=UPI00369DB5F8
MDRNEPGTDEARGDDVYQPTHSDVDNRPTDALDPDNAIVTDPLEDMANPGYSPPERPRGVTRYGTTQREQREGESLDDRLSQEVPEDPLPEGDSIGDLPGGAGEPVDEQAGSTRAGRLAPVDTPRETGNRTVARDVGPDDWAAPAEEAAMHVDTGADATVDEAEQPSGRREEPGTER